MKGNQEGKSEVMNGVLKEEYSRLEKMKKFYENEIEQLPKGSILMRIISKRPYYYLKYRDDTGAVRSKYIKAGDMPYISSQIKERRRLLNLLKQIKVDMRILGKVVK